MTVRIAARSGVDVCARLLRDERLRTLALAAYYLAVFVGLLAMYGQGQFKAPSYIYQRF